MLNRAARNAYSWWWASHIRTKQSKWLDQNLQDMEEKVEYIIKIIEEGGDSFAQRAEMYYRKRPELLSFVEDTFRGYRALAERYDHLSRELQTANRTIATVYPEQVQLAMDDEDEENFPSDFSGKSKQVSMNLPAAPKLNIPKTPVNPSKVPVRMMSKKGLIKTSVATITSSSTTSGMSKGEALLEIDKLQKKILGLQTEKEFVKILYESAVAKYWDIEEQVTEMQAQVSILQDEFGIGTFIEDDEARTLMAASALKSCQEALVRLQEKQKISDEEAKMEYQRVKQVHEKLEILKKNFSHQPNGPVNLEFAFVSESVELKDFDQEERKDLELLRAKIKEGLEVNSTQSVTMSELAEKIDDLVEKVITLETEVSSQNALVKRLRSETGELQAHLRTLEDNKEALIEGSDSKSSKITELEQELLRIQSLNKSVNSQNRNLQIHFTEASFSVDHLSKKLQNVKHGEEVDHIVHEDISKISKEKEVKADEVMLGSGHDSPISKYVRMRETTKKNARLRCNYARSKSSSYADDLLVPVEVRDFSNANPERRFKGNERLGREGVAKREKVLDQSSYIKPKENFLQSDLSKTHDDLFVKDQAISILGDNLVKGLNQHGEIIAHHDDKLVMKDVKMEEKERESDSTDDPLVKGEVENLFQFNPRNDHVDFSVNGQVRAVLGTNSEGFNLEDIVIPVNNPVILTNLVTELGEKKCDNQNLKDFFVNGQVGAILGTDSKGFDPEDFVTPDNGSLLSTDVGTEKGERKCENLNVKAEEEKIFQCSPSNPFDDLPRQGQAEHVGVVQDVVREREEHRGVSRPGDETMTSKDTIMRYKKNNHSSDYNPFREEKIVQYDPSSQIESLLGEFQVLAVQNDNPEKGFKEHEEREDAKRRKEEREDDASHCSTSVKANEEDEKQGTGQEVETENEDQPNWREMFLSGLDDREKTLLQQYTAILRNYKETKKKLSEIEKKSNDGLFKSAIQIKHLKNSNALKDAEIQSLHRKLNLLQVCPNETLNPDQNQLPHSPEDQKVQSLERQEESTTISSPAKRVAFIEELNPITIVEDKFRSDIDGLLEENIEFWLRFSTSFHQIQKFKTSVQDLQQELTKIRGNSGKQDGSPKNQSLNSDLRPIYNHLREIKTELALWLEHNALLEDDLDNRLSSLSSIQEELSRLSSAEEREETELSDYQAAKFQGEVLNMKQENNKVGYKLHEGLERVKLLKFDIAKTIEDLEDELGISASSKNQQSKRSGIPLRSFLFGVRLRRQKPSSFFQCMSPAFQKQYSDLNSLPP